MALKGFGFLEIPKSPMVDTGWENISPIPGTGKWPKSVDFKRKTKGMGDTHIPLQSEDSDTGSI